MRAIFLISGKAQHGKDTLAEMLKEAFAERGSQTLIVRFADYLKHICREYYGWDGAKDEAGRTILQMVGTDIVRKREPDFWRNAVCELISVLQNDYDVFIIPDTRFWNECALKLFFPGTVVRTVRVTRLNFDSPLTPEQQSHVSETALDDYPFDIYVTASSLHELENYARIIAGVTTGRKNDGSSTDDRP